MDSPGSMLIAVIIHILVLGLRVLITPSPLHPPRSLDVSQPRPEVRTTAPNISITSASSPAITPPSVVQVPDNKPWGEAWRQEDGSYTLKIQEDPAMSTPRELADAINRYRETKGVGKLEWSDTLSLYAQSRAEYIATNGSDHHEGFENFVQNEGGYDKLGFSCLGENMSEGFRLSGTHLVEWMYAQSPGHDANQLSTTFSRIGVGIQDTVSVLIFGGCF